MRITEIERKLTSKTNLLFHDMDQQRTWWKSLQHKGAYQPFLEEIREEAASLLDKRDEQLSFSLFKAFFETGSRLQYERVYFARRSRLNTFAVMCLLEPENQRYQEELENVIWQICNGYSWCLPAHLLDTPETSVEADLSLKQPIIKGYSIDLFAAETAFALSEIPSLTHQLLNPLIAKRIKEEVYLRIFQPFNSTKFKWETETHNWAAVCAGSVGAAALYLLEDHKELAAVLERVLVSMECYLSGFTEDGICLEGYGYWQYGFGFFMYFADLLKARTDGSIDLFVSEEVHQIALFQQRSFLFRNQVVNFSDSLPTASVHLGLSHYLSRIYSDVEVPEKHIGSAVKDHCSRWAPAIRQLLWFDEQAEGRPWKNDTFYSEEAQWLISRWQCENGHFSFAAKGGHNDEHHNHNDIGHFILQGNGESFLRDLGSGLYTKDYFREKRYSYLCTSSHGHSVPMISGQAQAEGADSTASIEFVSLGEERDIIEMDIARAYRSKELHSLLRKFSWVKGEKPYLVLEDCYIFNHIPDSIKERFMVPVLHVIKNEEGLVLQGTQSLKIQFDTRELKCDFKKLNYLNHFGQHEEVIALDFFLIPKKKEISTKFIFQFL